MTPLVRTTILLAALLATTPALAQGDNADKAQRLEQILADMDAGEPSAQETVDAALGYYRLTEDEIDSYDSRAEWKAVMPTVAVEFRVNQVGTNVDKFDFIQFGDQKAGLDDIAGSVQELKVQGVWDLPQLIYNPEVLDVHTLRGTRQALIKEVLRLYYLRRRLKVNLLLTPPADPASRFGNQLRIDEATATLDAMTGGFFGKFGKKTVDQ